MFRVKFALRAFMFLAILLIASSSRFSQNEVLAQDEKPLLDIEAQLAAPSPIIVQNFASIDRAMTDIGALFEVSGREDMMDVIEEFLGKANNLEGVDRTLPLGVMLFLDTEVLPPTPFPVFYLPVTDIQALAKTADLGPLKLKPVEGQKDRYELGSGRRLMKMIVGSEYAFISRNEAILDKELPDPRELTAGLTARYDVSAAVLVENIPPGIRTLLTTFIRSQAEADLQQRDEEAESSYKVRRANGLNMLDLMEQVVRDGKTITIGLEADKERKMAAIEILFDAKPDSEFSNFMKNIAGKQTYFAPLLGAYNPLSISLSWMTDKREQEALTGNVEALDAKLREVLPEENHLAVGKLTGALQATVDNGHVDAIFQFIPQEDQKFVLIAGMKLMGSESFSVALREVLDGIGELEGIDSLELDVDQYQAVTLHRLRGESVSDEDKRIYGGHPDLYIGAGNGVLWLSLGGESAITQLHTAVDLVLATTPGTRTDLSTAPFQAVFRMLPWLDLPEREGADVGEREIVEDSMEENKDAVRVEVRPTETGGRVRVQFDEGFVKLLGNVLAQLYDRTQI